MPSRPIHIATSTPGGAGYDFCKSNRQDLLDFAGSARGGYCGGILPVRIALPLHPGHRSFGRRFCPVFAGPAFLNRGLDGWQNRLWQLADEHASRRSQSTDPITTAWQAFAELALRSTSGFRVGIGARYITHVALLAAVKLKGSSYVD